MDMRIVLCNGMLSVHIILSILLLVYYIRRRIISRKVKTRKRKNQEKRETMANY